MFGYRSLVLRLIAIVLLAAAAMKLYGLSVAPVAQVGLLSLPSLQFAVVLWEIVLGLFLLWGKHAIAGWIAAVATFVAFAGASFYAGWIGLSSCGCFGAVPVSPWYAFTLDVVVLIGLGIAYPDFTAFKENHRSKLAEVWQPAIWGLAGVVLVAGIVAGIAHFCFGSIPAALAHFRGESVSIDPALVDVGTGAPGESREVTLTLTNWTDHPVRLFGGTADCSCTVLQDLPVTIPPKESRTVSVRVRLNGSPGIFTRMASFLVDDEGFKVIGFQLTGRIAESTSVSVVE